MNLGSFIQPAVANQAQPQGVPGRVQVAASGYVTQGAGGSVSSATDGNPAFWFLLLAAGVFCLLHYGRG